MSIVNQTQYTFGRYYAFFKRDTLIRRLIILGLMAVFTLLIPFWIFYIVASIVDDISFTYLDTIYGSVFLVFCVSMDMLGLKFMRQPKKLATAGAEQNATAVYDFAGDAIRISITTITPGFPEGYTREETLPYHQIHKVVEASADLYIYLHAKNAYIVAKDGFTEGTIEDLKTLLREKIEPQKLKIK